MKKGLLLVMSLGFLTLNLLGQEIMSIDGSTIVKGNISDSSSELKLEKAVAMIMRAQDSIMVDFARTDKDGNFSMEAIPNGDYILMVTFPDYADYVQHFTLDGSSIEQDFGVLDLTLRATLIEEVLITGIKAVTIKGDTTEFDARAYTIEPNSKVEDLLKQFPGIQIDAQGNITAQGETISKVLVDGEEFFGDDPTLVTRNIRGDMVSKVQLFDKKSDQAEFTGIDDGIKTKTLNIVLQEDKKSGYFGKIDVGAGSNEMYEGQIMFNKFNGNQKVAAYGTIGNTGKTGLNFGDAQRFGTSGGAISFGAGGGVMITLSGPIGGSDLESFDGRYSGRGIPGVLSGGVHYSDKWNENKHALNANYKIGEIGIKGSANTLSQNILPSGAINSVSDETFDNYSFRQTAGGIYDLQFTPGSTLKITVDGTLNRSTTQSDYVANSSNLDGNPLNSSLRNVNNETDGQLFSASALWRHKLKKEGRTLSWNLSTNVNQNQSNGFLYTENEFFNPTGALDSTAIIDQFKLDETTSTVASSNITYTEPLTTNLSLVLNYNASINNSNSLRQSFNQTSENQYGALDSLYSSNYRLNQLSNELGANFNLRRNKHTINFGTRMTAVDFDQVDRFTDEAFDRTFINWNPQALWQYQFSQQGSLRLNYNGRSTQPSISQIQPVRVNTDPLNITLGNPDLKPAFTNSLSGSYNTYKVLKGESIFINASYSTTHNPIVQNTTTDEVGKSIYISSNLPNQMNTNFSSFLNYSRNIKKININVGVNGQLSGNSSHSLINGELNKMRSSNYSGGLSLSQFIQGKYNFNAQFGPSYTEGQASLLPAQNNNGWGMQGSYSFSINLPAKFMIGSDGNYTFNGPTQTFDEKFERFTINANIQKKFLADETLVLRLSGQDLLGQNTGFSRSARGNFITQSSHTTITRFFMLSVIWDFNKMGGGQ